MLTLVCIHTVYTHFDAQTCQPAILASAHVTSGGLPDYLMCFNRYRCVRLLKLSAIMRSSLTSDTVR